jgi:hypothetical protein
MKKDIFKNNSHPFTVPDGYFDTLQERILNRIQTEGRQTKGFRFKVSGSKFKVSGLKFRVSGYGFRTLVAAAACVLFIFAGAFLYITYTGKHSAMAETIINEEFYQWFFASDRVSQMAESLDIHIPDNIIINETDLSEEDEAIIRFLERDNINLASILYSIDNETYLFR